MPVLQRGPLDSGQAARARSAEPPVAAAGTRSRPPLRRRDADVPAPIGLDLGELELGGDAREHAHRLEVDPGLSVAVAVAAVRRHHLEGGGCWLCPDVFLFHESLVTGRHAARGAARRMR